MDGSFPSPHILHRLLSLLCSFISSSSHFLLKFLISPTPSPLALTSYFSTSLSSSFPTASLVLPFSAKLPPLVLFMSVILWACPAVLLMLAVEHINTSNFDSINVLGLGTLPHTPDIWSYLPGGAPESGGSSGCWEFTRWVQTNIWGSSPWAKFKWCVAVLDWWVAWKQQWMIGSKIYVAIVTLHKSEAKISRI